MQFQQQQFNEKLDVQQAENSQLQRISHDLEQQMEVALNEIHVLRGKNEVQSQELHQKNLELIQKNADFKNLSQKYDYVIQKLEFLESQFSQRNLQSNKQSRYYWNKYIIF